MMSMVTESTFTFFIGFRLRWMILAGMCVSPGSLRWAGSYQALRMAFFTARLARVGAAFGFAAPAFLFGAW